LAAAKEEEALISQEEGAFGILASAFLRLAFAAEACGLVKRMTKFAGYL